MPPTPSEPTEIQACQARTTLRRQLDAQLRGTGIKIRDRAHGLTITNPDILDNGHIHITLTGDVTWKHTTWEYLGPLQGHQPTHDPDREPAVTVHKIIQALTKPKPPEAPH